MSDDSEVIEKGPCDACGSSDACAVYSDGHTHCFSCEAHTGPDREAQASSSKTKRPKGLITEGTRYAPIKARGLTEESCKKWGYQLGGMNGKPCQIANYKDATGAVIAQKVRFPDKDFTFLGKAGKAPLYGQWLWRDAGRKVVVTEGEIDAISVSQVQDHRWPVVSVPNGAAGAARAVARALEWLEQFDEVIFMFDMDDPGQEAARECAELLTPGKAKIAKLPLKDANEMLLARRTGEVVDAIFGANEFRPDGIVCLADLRAEVTKPVEVGLPWAYPKLTEMTFGRRQGELYGLGAGTGIGKTDFLTQQIVFDITELNEPVGLFYLEQEPVETGKRVAGKLAHRRFHVPDDGWTEEELFEAFDTLEKSGKVFLYDSFGATDWDVIERKIRYLAKAEGVRIFYLDHLTALAAGKDNEREELERVMASLGKLVKELKIIMTFVSHLATPDGKPHEEGGHVAIRHFKGSRAIGFWCHFMFGLERNQQDQDPGKRKVTTFRMLKDRYTGQSTGSVFYLGYDHETGLLFETDEPKDGSDYGFDDESVETDF